MTPLPAFRAIQAIYTRKNTDSCSENSMSDASESHDGIEETIRYELEKNNVVHLDPQEHNFLYKFGYAFLYVLTLGFISKALAYADGLNAFECYAENLKTMVKNIDSAPVDRDGNRHCKFEVNNLPMQIYELNCGQIHQSTSNEFYKKTFIEYSGKLVELPGMTMSDLLEFMKSDFFSKAYDPDHDYSYKSILRRVIDREKLNSAGTQSNRQAT